MAVKGGRPPAMRPSDIAAARAMMKEGSLPVRNIAQRMGVSVAPSITISARRTAPSKTHSQTYSESGGRSWLIGESGPPSYALVVHDWSRLQFHSHHKMHHRLKMTHAGDVGYELQSSLLVDAASGLPVTPLAQTLTDNQGCRSTLTDRLTDSQTHMDVLTADMTRVEALGIEKTLVHLIDREGDSVAHMRALSAQGLRWLIRGKEGASGHVSESFAQRGCGR